MANKKQRREAKRKEKRREARRRESVSPIKRLGGADGEIECWMTEGFETSGQVELFVYKRAAGISGMAWFLVDRGVVGLIDAWARVDVERGEFDDMLAGCRGDGVAVRRASVEDVRRWVAGGARWARENGMRLPREWSRPAAVIGGVGDWENADVSRFVKEFVGHPEDLRQRLVAEPFETYVRRKDVAFEFSEDAPYMDREPGQYNTPSIGPGELERLAGQVPAKELNELAQRIAPVARELAGKTAGWLATRGGMASPDLPDAWASVVLATMLARDAMADAPEKEVEEFAAELLDEISDRMPDDRVEEYERAMDQALDHLEADPELMARTIEEGGGWKEEG